MSGLFGVVSKNNCVDNLFYGTDYHSHLGTEFAGLAVWDGRFRREIHNVSDTQFKSKFQDYHHRIKGKKGIGVISSFDEQPIYINSHLGEFCIATNGLVQNDEALISMLLKKGVSFNELSSEKINITELIAKLITQGSSLVDGIERVFELIDGSCSMLILTKDGIYAVRDRYGYTPLVIGRNDEVWAVASETTAFPNLGLNIFKYLGPGEIAFLTEDGIFTKSEGRTITQICSFLWIYTGFPASSYEGRNVEVVRENCGRLLARRDKDINVDIVCGVPDSGISHALGYAMESGKPYRRPLVKYTPGYGRSYTPLTQEKRDFIAKMKLIPIREIIEGNRIVVCEDSIVRGTQLKNFTIKKLWEAGAKEIHIRVACPPLLFPCRFCLSTRSIDELATRRTIRAIEGEDIKDVSEYIDHTNPHYRMMVERIARDLEVTTLRYQTLSDMISAIGLPKEKLCLYCWTGEYISSPKIDKLINKKVNPELIEGKI
ncbi:MAG: amidophosphoribosyltransferase [Candidatus Omnitrophica bacterium]|nr:amidophosphoribosyltransferase [Candidatus Omnitrophota bacterium]